MCRPTYFNVLYNINPWMEGQLSKVDKFKAAMQWGNLVEAISKVAIVRLIEPVDRLPDLVFTANAGFIKEKTVILSNFAATERFNEEGLFCSWFENNNYNVIQPKNKYEGAGDHLVDSNDRHWLGTGFRTNKAVANELDNILQTNVNVLELIDPRWYHLDTCFCPLSNGEILWYPEAFSIKSQNLIRTFFDHSIEVNEEDAKSFACNTVCINNDIFIPQNTSTTAALENIGYKVHEFDMSEFLKSGGAVKCLTLEI